MKSSHTFDRSLLLGLVTENSGLGMLPVLSSPSPTSLLAQSSTSSTPRHQETQVVNMDKYENISCLHFVFDKYFMSTLPKCNRESFFFKELTAESFNADLSSID